METDTKIPSGWKILRLKELGTFSKGAGISKAELLPTGLNAVRYGEIYMWHHFRIKKIHSFISEESAKASKKIKFGDIVFAGSGETNDEIGKSAAYLFHEDCFAGGDIIIFTPKINCDSLFLAFSLNIGNARKELRELGQGQSVVHIYKKDIENITLLIPPLPEQEKIVEILETWDSYLERLTVVIRLKKKIKKGLMQRLMTGKMRLSGFSGKWKIKEVGEILLVITAPKKTLKTEFLNIGEYPIIDQSNKFIAGWTNDKGALINLNKPVVIFGDHTCCVKYIDHAFAQGADGIKILQTRDEVIPYFFYLFMQANPIKQEGYKRHFSRLNDKEINLPPLDEQMAITKIFTVADQEITVLEEKKALREQQRKYLLNNMVTGHLRLPEFTKAIN